MRILSLFKPAVIATVAGVTLLVTGTQPVMGAAGASGAAGSARSFSSPEEAVIALSEATASRDQAALRLLFGPAVEQLENPDRVQGSNELASFTTAWHQHHRLIRNSDTRFELEVGTNGWTFPVPLVAGAGGWSFDTAAGIDEMINRRVGRNELDTLAVLRAGVIAQREYASRDRDNDEVLEFAPIIASAPGKKDGLYWSPELDGEISPLGPFAARAQAEGYAAPGQGRTEGPAPFHGYYFKILTRQGKAAPGGRYDYIINGNMIGGFAFVAWPAEYGDTGVMTFIVNQQGRVYQKDLGRDTASIVRRMKEYNPDKTWTLSAD